MILRNDIYGLLRRLVESDAPLRDPEQRLAAYRAAFTAIHRAEQAKARRPRQTINLTVVLASGYSVPAPPSFTSLGVCTSLPSTPPAEEWQAWDIDSAFTGTFWVKRDGVIWCWMAEIGWGDDEDDDKGLTTRLSSSLITQAMRDSWPGKKTTPAEECPPGWSSGTHNGETFPGKSCPPHITGTITNASSPVGPTFSIGPASPPSEPLNTKPPAAPVQTFVLPPNPKNRDGKECRG